jgi:hypothetical protein
MALDKKAQQLSDKFESQIEDIKKTIRELQLSCERKQH